MAGIGTVIAGIVGGGVLVGGVLVAADPLKARRPPSPDDDIAAWSDGALDSLAAANAALQMLGYFGDAAVGTFQRDANEIFTWHRALAEGTERVPPATAGFTQIPAALHQFEGQAALATTGQLDRGTVGALADAVQAVVYATGKTCMTDQGEVMQADAADCLNAWQQAFRYAYEANTHGDAAGSTSTFTPAQTDDWGRPLTDTREDSGTYGPFLWASYKAGPGQWEGQYYYVTWKQDVGYGQPAGPFGNAAGAKNAAIAYIAEQVGEQPPGGGSGIHVPVLPMQPQNGGGGGGGGGIGG